MIEDMHRKELHKDSNRMAMEYAKDAIRFAFFLNGAAATALFAKTQVVFVPPAALFAYGAAFSVLCMGLTYIVQLFLSETWAQDGPLYTVFVGPKALRLTIGQIESGRIVAISFWAVSMIFFFSGAYDASQVARKLAVTI